MKLLNQSMNFNPLKEAIENAKNEILICSAWIRGEVLRKLITTDIKEKIRKGEISLKIITRIGERKDIELSGTDLFQFAAELGSHCEIRYHKTLHTKMYIVDETFAMLGSFNLTGGGFGTEEQPGKNIETGVLVTSASEIRALKQQFYDIWENEATKIDDNLIGFVLSNSTEREFYVIGIKALESGMFVTVRDDRNGREEYILGQIAQVIQINPLFYSFPSEGDESNDDMMKAFANSSEFVNLMAGLAEKQMGYGKNIHFARVKIKSRVIPSEDGTIVSEVNRFAPSVAGEVVKAQKNLLEHLYTHPLCKPAVLLSNEDVEAGLDPEKILRTHMAVFGSTGSGKSYFTKQLIKNYLKPWMDENNGRIIILDPHGEYASGNDFEDVIPPENIIPHEEDESLKTLESKVVEDADDLIEVCELGKLNRKQKDYLQQALRRAKGSTREFINIIKEDLNSPHQEDILEINWEERLAEEFEKTFFLEISGFEKLAKHLVAIGEAEGKNADERKQYAREYLFNKLSADEQKKLKEAVISKYVKEFKDQFSEKIEPILSEELVDTIIQNARDKAFRLEPYNFINKVTEPGIYCIDMRTIHDEEQRLELAGDILRGAFNKAKEMGKDQFKTLFVVEEAHNFAPEQTSKNNPAYRYMVKIAREGRKFGVGLMVISQRPAYVSKDVLAQCNTQAIFRLINPNDLKAVEATVEGISQEELYKLPNYQTGQCIFTGVAIKEPVVVKVKA